MQIFNEMLLEYETLISGDDSVVSRLEIEDLVYVALKAVYKYDKYLIDIRAHERDIVFRFGIYFQKLLEKHDKFKAYNLDVEYNRNEFGPKITENSSNNGVYPDVILHKRGNNEDNHLVMEFKGYWNNQGQEEDKSKIHDLMNPNGEYKYKNGYTVLLKENDFLVKSVYKSNISLL